METIIKMKTKKVNRQKHFVFFYALGGLSSAQSLRQTKIRNGQEET